MEVLGSSDTTVVHLVSVLTFSCTKECEERGLLGGPIGVPWGCGPVEPSKLSLLLFEFDSLLWPVDELTSYTAPWEVQNTTVQELTFPTPDQVFWTVQRVRTDEIEPDSGVAGTVWRESELWYSALLTSEGPLLRREVAVNEREVDDTYATRFDETEAEFAVRESEYAMRRDERNHANGLGEPTPIPGLAELPDCRSEGQACRPLCAALGEE